MTCCSADKVILRRQLSTQVLPSRSKRLFWNLFFRHLHKPVTGSCSSENNSDQNASYSSDTQETSGAPAVKDSEPKKLSKLDVSGLLNGESRNKSGDVSWNWNNIHVGASFSLPQNQWLSLSVDSSSLSRVDEWINNLDSQSSLPLKECGQDYTEATTKSTDFPPPVISEFPEKTSHITHQSNPDLVEEVMKANNIIKSMNLFSSTAHVNPQYFTIRQPSMCQSFRQLYR